MSEIIYGRNACKEALKSKREIEKITVVKNPEGSLRQLVAKAKEEKIPVYYSERSLMDKQVKNGSHQGIIALVSDYKYAGVDDILQRAADRGEDPFVILLDGIEDPHNLGAIMRTAECAGVHGIIIPRRNAASITDTVAKTSAGAVEHVLCAKVTNISREIEYLQSKGLWIGCCDMDGESYYRCNLKGAVGLVIGSEGAGVSRLVKEKSDFVVSIPMKGAITSLNASNAAAVIMYEAVKQRNGD